MEIWDEIEEAVRTYKRLNIEEAIHYKKFYIYSLIAHSTAIEGSTLTELETQFLLEEGITADGKPFIHHLLKTLKMKSHSITKNSRKGRRFH
jgi:hypothetical protein